MVAQINLKLWVHLNGQFFNFQFFIDVVVDEPLDLGWRKDHMLDDWRWLFLLLFYFFFGGGPRFFRISGLRSLRGFIEFSAAALVRL